MLNKFSALGAMLGIFVLFAQAHAQEYPSKPVRLIVGYAPGGGMDTFGRVLAEKLAPRLNGTVIVENKPGASGMIAAGYVAQASPDGYTLLLGDQGSIGLAPYLQKQRPFDTLTDFRPVTMLFKTQLQVYVRDDFPARSFVDFIKQVKDNPDRYSYATPGVGGSAHMFAELMSRKIGLKMVHVPYQGDAKAVNDVLAGVVPIWISAVASAKPYIETKSVRPVVTSGKERSFFLPEVPTVEESGYSGVSTYFYNVMLAPKGTPDDIVSKLNAAVASVYAEPATIERIRGLGHTPENSSPKEAADFVKADIDQWQEILKDMALK